MNSSPLCLVDELTFTHPKKSKGRNAGIIAAYQSGGYSMKEVGDHFGVHYSSVSKIIKHAEYSQFKT